jgi:hypothetical protein
VVEQLARAAKLKARRVTRCRRRAEHPAVCLSRPVAPRDAA